MPFWFVVSLGLSLLLFHFVDESLGWMIPLMLILMIRYQPPELTSLAEKKGWKAFLTLRYWPKKPPETSATPPAQPNVPATALPTATLPPDPASACPSCGGYLGPKICTAGCGYRRPTTPPAGSAPTTTSASGTSPNNLESALDLLWRRKNR
ncbi:hypothetical protein KKA33_02340 [Patescibacteria group bacterium]|nr:hypothetical protein [Patescibacteria group bacterium]